MTCYIYSDTGENVKVLEYITLDDEGMYMRSVFVVTSLCCSAPVSINYMLALCMCSVCETVVGSPYILPSVLLEGESLFSLSVNFADEEADIKKLRYFIQRWISSIKYGWELEVSVDWA